MIYCIGTILDERTVWEMLRFDDAYIDDGISISFRIPFQLNERESLNYLRQHMHDEERRWLKYLNGKWRLNLDVFREIYGQEIQHCITPPRYMSEDPNTIYLDFLQETKLSLDILVGTINVEPEYHHRNEVKETETNIRFIITHDQIMTSSLRRYF